jgi:hypothetical protein
MTFLLGIALGSLITIGTSFLVAGLDENDSIY